MGKAITKKSSRQECKNCHKKSFYISENNLCVKCSTEKVKLANLEMKHKEGPTYDKWRRKMIKSLKLEL